MRRIAKWARPPAASVPKMPMVAAPHHQTRTLVLLGVPQENAARKASSAAALSPEA